MADTNNNKNKVYETKRRQNVRTIKYEEMFLSTFEEVINELPDVLSEIISNYIKEECDSCKQKVFKLIDKTVKHIPTIYLPIPETEEQRWRTICPEWFNDYKVCEDCINNVCGHCDNILIINETFITHNNISVCDKCYNRMCARCGERKSMCICRGVYIFNDDM